MNLCKTIGLVLNIFGILCLSYDVVFPFRGSEYGGITAGNDDGLAVQTCEFKKWNENKYRLIKAGALSAILGNLFMYFS